MFAFRDIPTSQAPVVARIPSGHEPWRHGDDGDDGTAGYYGPGFGQTLRSLALITAVLIGIGLAKYMIWGSALPGHLATAQSEQSAVVNLPAPPAVPTR